MRRTVAVLAVVGALVLGHAGAAHAAGTLDGTVTEGASPSRFASVTLYREVGGSWEPAQNAQTDASGAFSFDVTDDTAGEQFRLGFSKAGWTTEFYDDKATLADATSVPIDTTVAVDLAPAPRITGTVTDEDTGDALADVVVLLFGQVSDIWVPLRLAFTDGSGQYTVDADENVPGPYKVGFGLEGYATKFYDDLEVFRDEEIAWADDVMPGDVADVALRPLGYFEGTVTSGGEPVEGVSVVAFDQGDENEVGEKARATTGPDGTYRVYSDVGEFIVRFAKNGLRTEYYDDSPDFSGAELIPVYGSNPPPGADADAQLNIDADLAPGTEVEDLTRPKVRPRELAKSLGGPGVTIEEAKFTGDLRQAALFQNFAPLGLDGGIALSTGAIEDVMGPNDRPDTSGSFEGPGDADLQQIAAGDTFDAAVLELTVIPESDRIRFGYVFGSEEYNEYIDDHAYPEDFHDVFAFYINGKNCALIGDEPVSVGTVNSETNSQFFRNNDFGPRSPFDVELDGLTTEFECNVKVKKGARTNIKLAIADVGDWGYDSAVFLEQGSLRANEAPTADDKQVSTRRNTPVDITLTGEDPDGETVTFDVIDQPANGTLSGSGAQRTYTPNPGFVGSDSFTYVTVDEDNQASLLATVTIDVTPGPGSPPQGPGSPPQTPPVQTAPPPVVPPVQTPAKQKQKLRKTRKRVKLYSSYRSRKAWLRAKKVRLPRTTKAGQPVRYTSRTKAVCKVSRIGGIWRVRGKEVGVCKLRVRAAGTDSVKKLSRTVKVRIRR